MLNFPNHALVNVSGGPVLSIDVGPVFAKMIVLGAGTIDVRYDGTASGLYPFLQNLCGTDWATEFFNSQYFGDAIVVTPTNFTVAARGAVAASASGQAAQSLAIADLNGDGSPDTVSLKPAGAVVQLLASDGSVLSTNNVALGFSPASFCCDIVVADFNHDDKPDLAITNYFGAGGSDLVILLGNGDGSFGNPRSFASGGNPAHPAVADFNGDGKPDIVLGNLKSSTVSLLLGNGDGTFGPPVPFATGEDSNGVPWAIVALDLNGDGAPDLAVANGYDNSVSVLLNSGGKFKAPMITAIPFSSQYLAYADLNHDGKPDLVVASQSNALVILTGNGDGTFQAPASYATTSDPESVGVLPLSDGYTVLCSVDRFTYDVLATIVSPRGQVFTPLYNFIRGNPNGIAAGDLNGDGQPDVVITGTPSGLSVAIAQSGTRFKAPVGYSLDANSSRPRAIAIGDLNGDHKNDVITANYSSSVSVLLGNGDGTLQPAMSTPVNHTAQSIAVADFNGDQKLDVVVAGSVGGSKPGGAVTVLLGKGDGAFQTPRTMTVNALLPVAVAAGDLNGDGKQDLAVLLVANFDQDQPATVAVFLGQANGTFAAPRTFPSALVGSSVGGLAIGDVNGDSKPDLVMISPGGNQGIDIMLGDGAGNFHEAATLPNTDTNPWALVLADLNRDGKLDLVVGHYGGAGATFLLGNGDGTFQVEQHFLSGPAPIAVAVTKFSGGPGPDLVFAQGDGTWLSVVNAFPLPIVNVTSTAPNGTYGPGATIPITITYGGPVTVTGTPQLALNSGGIATYVSGSGSATLTFNYAVAAGQNSSKLDYSSTDAIVLNGSAILDANHNGASFTPPPPGVAGSVSANKSIVISTTLPAVLSIAKGHSGNFTQGQTGATYTVTVSNTGQAPTSGTVTMTETVPDGLTLTSMAGTGWTCPAAGTTCTRSDALAAGASYPPITVTVNVAADATSPQDNTVSVTGGATATDSTVIAPPASLSITKTHTGNFAPGQQGATYTVTVTNAASAGPTNGLVVVNEAPPTALAFVSMSGDGWNCAFGCIRTDALAGGSSYPPITVTFNVAADATSPQVNQVTVSGGGSATASAMDSTIIDTGSGDFNGNGGVGVDDAQTLINMVLGVIPATPNADLNRDGKVDVADVQLLINVILVMTTCPN